MTSRDQAEKLYDENYQALEAFFDKTIEETEKSISHMENKIGMLKDSIKSTKKALKTCKEDKESQLLNLYKNRNAHIAQYVKEL
jgi:hypothetical protein